MPNNLAFSFVPRRWQLLALVAIALGCQQKAAGPAQPDETYEAWDAVYMKGAKVGYGHSVERTVEREGRPWRMTEDDMGLSLERFGQKTEVEFKAQSWLTPEGKLDHFESRSNLGGVPSVTTGQVVRDKLVLNTTVGDREQQQSIPWSDDTGDFNALDRSLRNDPLEPGEKRTIRALLPIMNLPVDYDLVAHEIEPVTLPTGTRDLLKVEVTIRLPQGETRSVRWIDREGETLKDRSLDGLATESFRTTREVAMAKNDAIDFDLGLSTTVILEGNLEKAVGLHDPNHREAKYRVTLADRDPAKVFVADDGQLVKSIDEHTAEIIVRPVRGGEGQGDAKPVSDVYLEPSSILESDNPAIVAAAEEVAGQEADALAAAQLLESYVHQAIENKNFSQAFATAAAVMESKQGDCTEHSVLLAALARALKIPSRGAMGLVFMHLDDGRPAMAFHMWTEVFVDGRWIALDGTIGQGGIGVGHIKIANSALEGDAAYAAFMPIIQAMNGLEIELVDVD